MGCDRTKKRTCVGKQRSEKIGSKRMLKPFTWSRNDAWPSHVSCMPSAGGLASAFRSTGTVGTRSLGGGSLDRENERRGVGSGSAAAAGGTTHVGRAPYFLLSQSMSMRGMDVMPWSMKDGHGLTNPLPSCRCHGLCADPADPADADADAEDAPLAAAITSVAATATSKEPAPSAGLVRKTSAHARQQRSLR